MKLNVKIFYPVFFVALIAGVVIYTTLNKDTAPKSNDISNKTMPNDTLHKGLSPHGDNPGAANVAEEILKEMQGYRKKIDSNPKDTASMRALADMFAQGHKTDSALTLYKKILDLDPKRTDIYFAMSFIYYIKGDIDKTEELTKKVLALDKGNAQAVYNLGAIAAIRGDKVNAKRIWEEVVKKNPGTDIAKSAQQQLEKLAKQQ